MKSFQPQSMMAGTGDRRSGSALIITLCFLVIMSALLLALFSSTRNDLVNSKVFASGQATILLAETAVNLVQGQITDASSQPLISWASQPGMIHTYDTNSSSSSPTAHTAYKLYSSDAMVVPNWSSTLQSTETSAMTGWKTATDPSSYNAMWCDLNAPAVVNRTSPTNTAVTVATPVFPIVDPGAMYMNGSGVEGFGFANTVPGTTVPASATDPARRLPMPVKWMYVLKNGQLIAPTSMSGTVGTSTVATFAGAIQPASTNQIIGRIAFWADDDTCKVNVNTACEGTFWDIPRANIPDEWYLGFSVPILDEFQAISGHPATTCLDPVLGDLLPRPTLTNSSVNTSTGAITTSGNYSQLEAYYSLNPRVSDTAVAYNPYNVSSATTSITTSEGGTVSTDRTDGNVPTVLFKSDRLYATPDEFLFNPSRGFNTNLTAATLAQRDFFLTAQSRAPETTLFGTPRISMWPIQQIVNPSQVCQSARDRLIHFCATVGGTNYDFQRGQVSVYGSSGSYNTTGNYIVANSATSITNDWNITRNQNIFSYATNMMAANLPGFGSSLAQKWGTSCGPEREMTLAMDMIRSGLSQVGTTTNATPMTWSYRNEIPGGNGVRGSVIPLQVTTAHGKFNGIGRDWRVASAALQIIPTARVQGTNSAYSGGWAPTDPQPFTTQVQAILLLNFYNPMPTPQIVEPSFRVTVTNPASGTTGGLGISVPGGSTNFIGSGSTLLQYGIGGGGEFNRNYPFPGYWGLLYVANSTFSGGGATLRTFTPGGTDLTNSYPWVTSPLTCNTNSAALQTVSINPGTISIQVQEGGPNSANTVQTENLYFPGWSGPVPQVATIQPAGSGGGTSYSGSQTGTDPSNYMFTSANRSPQNSSGASWFQPGDIVREVQLDPNGPTKGDYRLMATAYNTPTNWFAPNPNYTNSFNPFVTTTYSTATAAVQAEIGSMTNRFAFSFPNTGGGTTYGVGNGYDSGLGSSPRWAQAANVGTVNLGLGSSLNLGSSTWNNSGNYTSNPGGLVSNLKLFADTPMNSSYKPNNPLNSPPVIPQVTALANPPPTTSPATGWEPTNSAASSGPGDWSTGYSSSGDGAIFSAPDTASWDVKSITEPALFIQLTDWPASPLEAVTEPNRVVPSPIGIFGSLPTPAAGSMISGDGYKDDLQPWQSLLLCPNPAAGNTHPGFGQNATGTGAGPTALPPFTAGAPDHLFVDLFWMPVVEPYAISDPLSTAGKVNLNYEMEPFTHITRRTAQIGVLTPVQIAATPNSVSYQYKPAPSTLTVTQANSQPNVQTRFPLNLDTNNVPGGTPPTGSTAATGSFSDFENRFNNGDVFRSASEVCMIRLVPSGQTLSSLSTWWNSYQLTGLNMRESPYNQIYSRITTKSNTYTVHYWVQSLQQVSTPGRNWSQWNEAQDVISGEYRGHTTIERYLDPNLQGIPDYATVNLSNYKPIDSYYSWRVVSQKQFAPGSN